MKVGEVSSPADFLKKMKDPSELIIRNKVAAVKARVEQNFKILQFAWSVKLDSSEKNTYLLTLKLYSPKARKLQGSALITLANLVERELQNAFGDMKIMTQSSEDHNTLMFGAIVK